MGAHFKSESMQPLAIKLRQSARPIVAETQAELLAALASADEEADTTGQLGLIDIKAANGNTLFVAVGGPETVLGFRPADGGPQCLLSRGPVEDAEPAFECFLHFAEAREYPRWAVIPRDAGIAALEEFAASNELPMSIEWSAPATT